MVGKHLRQPSGCDNGQPSDGLHFQQSLVPVTDAFASPAKAEAGMASSSASGNLGAAALNDVDEIAAISPETWSVAPRPQFTKILDISCGPKAFPNIGRVVPELGYGKIDLSPFSITFFT